MARKTLFLSLACLAALSLTAVASENIRVVVANNLRTVTLGARRGLLLEAPSRGFAIPKMLFRASSIGTRPVRVRSATDFIQVNGESYRGRIELRKDRNGRLVVINDLDIEDYLRGVIAAEIPPDWEFEALKAQAVASRTYALYRKKKAGGRPYHIVATVNGQVYAGKRGERARTDAAVRETEGIVVTYGGKVIPAFYHSSCGGHTESAWELWGIDAPYLRGVDCECQEISKYGPWEKRLSKASVVGALGRKGYRLGRISAMEIEGISAAGRVKQVAIHHAGGITVVPAEALREAIGSSVIPSVFFEISTAGNDIIISGRGLGHGVGLCQWGAREMAQRGRDYKAILKHYYPGTTLTKLNDPSF